MVVTGDRLPWRHQARPRDLGDEPRAFLRVFIGNQRKGRNFTLVVAGRAVLIEDGRDIPGKHGVDEHRGRRSLDRRGKKQRKHQIQFTALPNSCF